MKFIKSRNELGKTPVTVGKYMGDILKTRPRLL